MKCKQPHPGFELQSPIPFPLIITILLSAPPHSVHVCACIIQQKTAPYSNRAILMKYFQLNDNFLGFTFMLNNFFNHPNINVNNYDTLITIFHSFLNKSISIIMDCCYHRNPISLWVVELNIKLIITMRNFLMIYSKLTAVLEYQNNSFSSLTKKLNNFI